MKRTWLGVGDTPGSKGRFSLVMGGPHLFAAYISMECRIRRTASVGELMTVESRPEDEGVDVDVDEEADSDNPPSSKSSISPTTESAIRIQPAFLSKTTKRLRWFP